MAHRHEAINRLIYIDQRRRNRLQELVEPEEFLLQDSVHGLFVQDRMLLRRVIGVEGLWEFREDFFYLRFYDVVSGGSSSANVPGKKSEHRLADKIGFDDRRGNFGIFVEAEHLSAVVHGQILYVVQGSTEIGIV